MRQNIKIPRILKIEDISDYNIRCMFNNGESRVLPFGDIFKQWQITENDIEYPLLQEKEFKKVQLRNYTLSWPNVQLPLKDENGNIVTLPYEIGSDVLYELSSPVTNKSSKYGRLIRKERLKAGLTQQELASRSGTTRFYISRVENDKTDVEMSTLRKIIEAGLGKKMRLIIE
jgi:DNA-binding XRE family transcriptional regulator